jgi:glutaredoxin
VKSFCLLVLSLLSFSVFAEPMYKWVDETGKTHYSDQPPASDVKSLQEKNVVGGKDDGNSVSYAAQAAAKKNPVVLYSSTTCGDVCEQAKQLLSKRGIPFTEKNANDGAVAEELKKLINTLEVPVLLVGETKLRGLDESAWHSTLTAAGYPKTALKPFIPQAPAATPNNK